MDTSANHIINTNLSKFELWTQQLHEYLAAQDEPGAYDETEYLRIFFQTNELLIGIANNFFTYGKFKDQWDTSKCSLFPGGQYLLLKSEKMGLNFHWGLDNKGFYIESYVICPENLRYMTDDFWMSILDLKHLGEFEFTGSGGLTAEEKPFFENKTSIVFQMIRRFMLFQMDEMKNPHSFQYSSLNMESLNLKWDFGTDWTVLLNETCQAFKLLYKINYQLWKISDLAKKKQNAPE